MGIRVATQINLTKLVKKVKVRSISFDPDLTNGFAKIEYDLVRGDKVLKSGTLMLGYTTNVVLLETTDLEKEAQSYAKKVGGYVLQIDEKTRKAMIGTGPFYDLVFTNCNGKLLNCILQKIRELVIKEFSLSK